MMSSSPPHNGTNNYNVNGTYNSQNLILTSSPTNDDELNLQLQNLENIEREHGNGSNVHFLDSNNLEIDQPNDLGLHLSNQSNFVTSHTNASNSDNSLTFDSIQANRTLDPNSEFIKNDAAVVNDYNRTDFLTNLDIDTPHYSNVNHQMDESEFEDFVPVSTNLHSNLQFPGSSSYLQVNSLASTSNSSSTSFSQSLSGNSLSSHLQNTPLQPSRKLPAPASHNTPFRTPSQIEINSPKRRSSFITPRVINSISTNSIHRRSKSKINITDESPAQGNPFYNPPSFLSPKVTKKSHRKTVSISNSISLSHLDADLNYQQQLYNNNNQSLIIDTPLRTPSERFVRNGDLIDDEDEDAERVKHPDENEIETANGQVDSNPAHLDGTTGNDSLNLLGNNMHTEQFGTRFGDRLIQSSQDLNRVLSNQPTNKNFNSKLSLSGEMIVKQPSPLLESTNFNTYLNDMLMDPATVESFGSDLFSFPQKDDSLINNDRNSSMESYYDSFENTFRQKQKSNYQSLKSANNTLLPPQMDIPLVSNASASSVPLVADLNQMSKSSSLPQSRENINDKSYGHHPTSSTVESKMQKSKSSFNLSNIAASREIKSPNYGYIKQEYPFSLDDSSFRMQSNQLSHSNAFIQLQQQSAYPSNYIVQDDSSTPMRNSIGIRTASLNMVAEKSHQRLTRSVCVLPSNASENNSPMASSSALKPVSNTSISESPIRNTISKAHSDSLTTLNIKKPEKLDLPQQSKRSKSRSKKTANDDKKIHECPLCHMRFQRPEHVKRHMLSHSSERPFACPEEGCGKRFNRNDNLKQHLRNIHKRTL